MGASYVGLALLLIISQTALSAPVADEPRDLQEQESYPAEGCYYNFEHYEEGDRIVTNEPCLNCTCHNHMLMCYLRVCPFTKAIGQDCTVEKKPDQCCPVITCPEVPVQLLTSSTTQKPTTISTAVGRPDNYGCTLSDNTFYPDGAQVPSDPRKPCELCYCIRNRTACVMQECTLQVEGCQPVYQQGVCCPVRYDCDYDSVTTPGTTVGLITTPGGPSQCLHDGVVYNDGEMVEFKGKSPCEHCYCMRGDVVCAVQECGTPLQAPDCVPLPPPPGHCCPDTFQCANGTVPLESLLGKPEAQDDSHSSEIHSGENSHSNEPAHDSAAEGSESSEEQKKPLGEDSGSDSSASSQDAQNNIDDTNTNDKVTEPAIDHVPQENQVLDDNVNHEDIEAGTEAHQDGETNPEVDDKIPEEQNIIYGENDSKPVGDLSSESLVHDKTESSDNSESQLPVEEDHIESKPDKEHDNDHQTTLNETENDLSPEDASLQNKGDGQDDSSALSHDDNKEKEHEHVNANENEGEENVSPDITPVNLETTQTDSGESMVTGEDVESHKGSSADNEEGNDKQENKEPSSIDSSHVDDKIHVTEGIDSPQSINTESPNESTNESQNFSYEPTHTQESSDLPESEAEKNRIHGVTPETYTEVSVETVEVHTSTPEINHPQENPTSQASIIDSSLLSTEGPVATQADAHNSDESHNQGDQNEATTIISNDSLGDHDVTTMLDSGNIPRLPGEGNCIIDGQTYKHNSDVHTRSACQVSCKCLNSIVHCKLVECPPAPTQYANCMPLEDHESCCPSYTCDDKPSLPLEVHSQVSTEFPEGAEQGESVQQEQHEYNGPSDHEEPSHDQAHSSSDGSEAPVEETKKPDEESISSIETSSHNLDNALEHSPPSKDGEPAEQKPSENQNNLENVITHIPSNEEGDSGKPANNDDITENTAEVHLSDPSLEASQDSNHELDTTQDSNSQDQLPHQNGEEEAGNIQVVEGETSKPEDKHEEDIGIVSIEHDSNNPLANENQDKPEEHDSESVSHSPAEIPLDSDGENHSELEDSTVTEHKPENHQEDSTSTSTDPTLITDENESSNLSPEAENDHPDEATLNQISNNEIIHQTHSESDHSPELHADGEITEPPTTSTAAQPIGSSSDTDTIPPEFHEGVIDKEEAHEPQNHHDSENESSDQEVEISQNESGSDASDDHHQNENENEINHANDIPQGSSTTIEQPDHPAIGESTPDTHQTNNEEILPSDNANSDGTDQTENPEIEEQKVDPSSHGADDNLVHNEVGSEVSHQPEVNENNEPQLHEHEASDLNQESESNEVNGNDDSSLHPTQHDSTSAEEENIVNPTTNEDSVSNLSEQTENQQVGDNVGSQNEVDKPEDHELPSQPQDNTIPIEDGVGGIVHHDTPNDIESILTGEHPLPGIEKESGETQDDTSIHHTEQALEGTGEEHHDGSSPEGENVEGISETHDSSEQHHEVSPGFGSDEHQPIESVGKEEEKINQGTEESHEASIGTDDTESHIAPEETLTHPENHGENMLDENQHPVLTDHQDETESNEVIEGSSNLQTGEDGGHGESDNSVENSHDTSVPVESIESQSEENEGPHKVELEPSEENSNQEASVPVNKEEEQHDSSDHEGGKPGSSEEEQHEVSQPSNEDNDNNQEHSLPTSEEGSHEESVSSDEGQHGTSSSTDSEVEQEHTSSTEEHLNEPIHHQGNENEHAPTAEEHEEIPTAHDDNNIEHAPTEVEHHDTSASQETSTDKIAPTVEEHHDTPTVEDGGEAVHTPTEEEHDDTSALQEANTGDQTPSEEELHEPTASQEDEHIDKPSSQETGELEQTHNADEGYDSTASQGDDHSAAEEEEHVGHELPATQEVGSDEHSTSTDGQEDRPTSPEAIEGDNTPSGEAQSESANASEEQNILTSEETEKESSSGETSQDHHDLSSHPAATQGTDRPEDEVSDDHNDQSSPEEQSPPETPVLETQGNEELSEKPSEPETNQDTAHQSSDSESHEHLTDSIETSNEGQIENEGVDEISHHEDDVKPDLTIADHHIEEDHHNAEQGPSEGTAQEESHKDSDTSGLPEVTDDQGLSHTDSSGEPQEVAVDDNTHNEIPSAPELSHTPESNEHQDPSGPEVNEESHIPHHTEPAEGTDGLQQNEQLEENVGSEQTEHSSVDQESGAEEHVGDQHAGQDSTQPQDSAVDENLSSQLGTEENRPVDLGDETNKDHSSHGSVQEDNSEPSEAAFHVEEHESPTANPADSDAVINAVYAVVHQQEESNELGNSKKPSIGQDVDYTGSGIHDIDSTNQANDLIGQPPQELPEEHIPAEHAPEEHNPEEHTLEEHTPEEVHSENVPTEQHAEDLPQEHHPEHIPEEHNTEHLSEEHLSEQSPGDHLPEDQPILHTPVEHAESIPEETPVDNIPVEHQQEHVAETNHDEDHQGEPDSHEHEAPVQHAPEDNEHVHETPEHPSVTEIEQPLVNEDSPEDAHGHTDHYTPTVPQTENEHSEGETNKFAEEVPVTDQNDSDQLDQSHHQTEAAAVPVEESKPDSIHEEPVQPIQHIPEHLPESEDKEKLPTASGQPELSTENAFTTVMHEIFGSTNVVTPDHQQVQENEYFQPGGPLFPNWSQKPADHITTSKPLTVPQIPEDSQYPFEQEQDYEEEDSNYSPGTCRYGGKVYLSAQQIPRDDPCDFCFCFRSDIICLQQSCPPPIQHCYQENIPGFCCPRYECHVSMATMVNVTTTTTTTTTTLPPHFLAHAYKGQAKRTGCQVKGVAYRVGERIASTSGPCLECRCGADGQMKCDPTVCNPQETLLRQVMDAAVISRRRRHIMTTPYFTARRLR